MHDHDDTEKRDAREREQYILQHAPRYHCEVLTNDAVLCATRPDRAPISPDDAVRAAFGRAASVYDRRSLIPPPPTAQTPPQAAPARRPPEPAVDAPPPVTAPEPWIGDLTISVRPAADLPDEVAALRSERDAARAELARVAAESAQRGAQLDAARADLLEQGRRAGHAVHAARRLRDALQAPGSPPPPHPAVAEAHRELCVALAPYEGRDDAPSHYAQALAEERAVADRAVARMAAAERERDAARAEVAEARDALQRLFDAARSTASYQRAASTSPLARAVDAACELLRPPSPLCDPARKDFYSEIAGICIADARRIAKADAPVDVAATVAQLRLAYPATAPLVFAQAFRDQAARRAEAEARAAGEPARLLALAARLRGGDAEVSRG